LADPYATRAPDLSGRPEGPPPWEGVVADRGGVEAGAAVPGEDGFTFVHCRGVGTLAPIARLDPALAVLLWIEHSHGASRGAEAANQLLASLRSRDQPIYAIKQGMVGGPPDRAGCAEVDVALVEAVLAAAEQGAVDWERDLDFGYGVPGAVEGLDLMRGRILLPRLLYADHDRVYEHAGLVAAKKHERYEAAAKLRGLDPEILAASGWPPLPTAGSWRE
jgi:hypothetical protein